MKTHYAKFGFHKADELESAITLKAIKWAWVYSTLFLLVWCVMELILSGSFPGLQFLLLSTQNVIFFISHLYFRKKMGLADKIDDNEK